MSVVFTLVAFRMPAVVYKMSEVRDMVQ